MQRTQVYFPKEILDTLRKEAFEKKTTLAGVIREKVVKSVKTGRSKPSQKEINKRLKLLDEISQLNIKTHPWNEMEKLIAEAKDRFTPNK